ncbi:hypothetical protein [Enterococcus sp. AZ192]|uniref:hypothetical protein n=1 Tax=unclassified Enterococcus TaxID=2608891 RepID=UPI003D267592
MNKKIVTLLLGCLALLVGCKKEEAVTLSKEDQAMVWQESQEKTFGKFDYLDVSEKEAQEIMKEKFEIALPKMYTSSLPILEETLQTNENTKEDPVYSVVAAGDSLTMKGVYSYRNKPDGKYYSYAIVELIYQYDKQKKIAWLNSQSIMIYNYPEDGKIYLNEPEEALEKLSALTKVDKLEDKMTTFKKQIDMPAEELQGQEIPLENSLKQAEKDKEVARNLGMTFGDNGTLSAIRVFVKDYTEK